MDRRNRGGKVEEDVCRRLNWQDGQCSFVPLLFTALVDAIQRVSLELGATWIGHYIDDLVTIGLGCVRATCVRANLRHLKGMHGRLGMPLDEAKKEGPTTVLTFLRL